MTTTSDTPQAKLLAMIHGYNLSQTIYVAAKLGIADLLADGPRTASELAAVSGTHAPSLQRVLRALASVGVLSSRDGRYALTPIGDCLRDNHEDSLRHAAVLFNEEPYRAHAELLESVLTGETAFDRQHGMGHFEFLETHPDKAETFNRAMAQMTQRLNAEIARSYDFSRFTTLVDLGGGYGRLLAGILAANPALQGIVFDLPSAVAGAPKLMRDMGVADRCAIVAGDMFVSVPRADAFVLKSVIHDWNDERSIAILRACREAIDPNGRLLLVERVVPAGDEPFWGKFVDLVMLVMSGGRERTAAEYGNLFAAAGLTLGQITPTSIGFHLVEAIPSLTWTRS